VVGTGALVVVGAVVEVVLTVVVEVVVGAVVEVALTVDSSTRANSWVVSDSPQDTTAIIPSVIDNSIRNIMYPIP
jgi:hypothetical protein